jgi:hypothetical protein
VCGKGHQKFYKKKSKWIYGDYYDYSLTEYNGSKKLVTIICQIHGHFKQSPKLHKSGYGCWECAKEKIGDSHRLSASEFIEKSKSKHGDKFIFDKLVYINMHTNVTLGCSLHGYFDILPHSHLRNHSGGCKQCALNKKSMSFEDFLGRARQVHGDFYNYDHAKVVNSKTPIKIICPIHGEFTQTANSHLSGKGCRECGIVKSTKNLNKENNPQDNKNRESLLYHIKVYSNNGKSFEKIGTTTRDIEQRFASMNRDGFSYEVIQVYNLSLYDSIIIEDYLLEEMESNGIRYKIKALKGTHVGGWTECFPENSIDIDYLVRTHPNFTSQ